MIVLNDVCNLRLNGMVSLFKKNVRGVNKFVYNFKKIYVIMKIVIQSDV